MENLGGFDNAAAREALKERNTLWQAQSLIRSSERLRKKYEQIASGNVKKAVEYLRDPTRPKAYVKWTMSEVDGMVQTSFEMDDSKLWEECAKIRRQEAEDKKAGLTYKGFGCEWFKSTFLLELYIILKYGIDLRDQEWQDPTSEIGKKLSWIIDRDEFAKRYKTTEMMETRNMPDPFAKKHTVQ